MKFKRTRPDEMLAIVQEYWSANPGPLSGDEPAIERFIAVPKHNVLLRANSRSVQLFFSLMGLRGSLRALILKALLLLAVKSDIVLNVLLRRGLASEVLTTNGYCGVKWHLVDAVLAEWQFVACFSSTTGTVTHCLSSRKYDGHLSNELDARKELATIIPFPSLINSTRRWPSGWTEGIIESKHRSSQDQYDKIQHLLADSYLRYGQRITTRTHIDSLLTRAYELYAHGNSGVLLDIQRIAAKLDSLLDGHTSNHILIARCHGDLNLNQILGNGDDLFLIDWSESKSASVYHDYVYSSVFHYHWSRFRDVIDVPELKVMRCRIQDHLASFDPLFCIGLVILEVAIGQHVDYNEYRGTIGGWTEKATLFLSQ